MNSIERLVDDLGIELRSREEIEEKVTSNYQQLFSSSNPREW